MEVVTGALPSVITKLGELLAGEYNLQTGVKVEIRFLKAELESMQGALVKVSNTPADQLDIQDKIWARDLKELSYDIEDSVDTFTVRGEGNKQAQLRGIEKFIDRSVGLFRKAKIRHGIATEIRDIKSRVEEVAKRRDRYKIENQRHQEPVTIDPRLYFQYEKVTLVGIEEARDKLINRIMTKENGVPVKNSDRIVSIVGFGGLGKTTLANAVFEKIKARFDCHAFVSVSQTPDLKKLFRSLLYYLGKNINEESLDEAQLINILREFLQNKRYFVVIDDLWDISIWKIIRCALPDNDVGYIVITTTRITNIAEQAGGAYQMEPLSLNDSRKLLYGRIFGFDNKENNEGIEKCTGDELAEVSDKILKKCAGVPLAIIMMASLLSCKQRNKMEWYEVCNSIGTGLENNLDVENMRKILSFSYYELPCHLRSCLLYLSMFPEDSHICKDQLISMWIAEGFIQCEKQGKSLVELGESYFNELINRSLIMPVYDMGWYWIYGCRVHDMVLDLISYLSSGENFATVLNDIDRTSPSNTIRRLSLQSGKESHIMNHATSSLQHARSVVVFPSANALVPALGYCQVLRVLHLEDCDLSSQVNSFKYIGNLYHLRYLGLNRTRISQLPEEIGNLQFLQTLDLRNNREIASLPSTVVQLRNLISLYIYEFTRMPNGIGNLICLERFSTLGIDDSTINVVEELGQLTELRRLSIRLDQWNDKLLECLSKLEKIQELEVEGYPDQCCIGGLDAWVAPRHLRLLDTKDSCWFSTLPAWVNPSHLVDLTVLNIAVRELHQVDLEVLGRLPALKSLVLMVDNKNLGILQRFIVGAGAFPCLVRGAFYRFIWPMVFQQGAMPKLRSLRFRSFHICTQQKEVVSSDSGLDLGLGNLPSLQGCLVSFEYEDASKEEEEQAKAALRHAVEMHPNHPDLYIMS